MDILTVVNTTIATIGAMLTAWISFRIAKMNTRQKNMNSNVEEYHKEVNGKMTQLLAATKKEGKREGKEEERKENLDAKKDNES